jgi:hypothetical protein
MTIAAQGCAATTTHASRQRLVGVSSPPRRRAGDPDDHEI